MNIIHQAHRCQYLVEIPVRDAKAVPAKWVKISKSVRHHSHWRYQADLFLQHQVREQISYTGGSADVSTVTGRVVDADPPPLRTKEREQHKESLAAVSRKAFLDFQSDISECHELVVVSKQIAVIDCLMSLAQVAAAAGYTKPTFVAAPQLSIREGRHPMVSWILKGQMAEHTADDRSRSRCSAMMLMCRLTSILRNILARLK